MVQADASFEALVIGAGFAGLDMLHRPPQLDIRTRAPEVAETWACQPVLGPAVRHREHRLLRQQTQMGYPAERSEYRRRCDEVAAGESTGFKPAQ